ncbi:MAG: hypothetical protein HGA19_21710 [Oscillochloris sp.]|nr:hypothetical protein [Oscillochloris sp.]
MPAIGSRPSSNDLENDRAIVVALQDLSDYAPTNPACSLASLRDLVTTLTQAEEAELRAKRALEVAREQAIAAAKKLHSTVGETKVQVMAQYGVDSPVIHIVGLKQRSERKRRSRRASTAS